MFPIPGLAALALLGSLQPPPKPCWSKGPTSKKRGGGILVRGWQKVGKGRESKKGEAGWLKYIMVGLINEVNQHRVR